MILLSHTHYYNTAPIDTHFFVKTGRFASANQSLTLAIAKLSYLESTLHLAESIKV